MTDYDNTNTGALFNNKDKNEEHPSWADYEGSAETQCAHCGKNSTFWLSARIKKAKKGKREGETFLSLSLKPKQQKETPSAPPGDSGRPF